MAQLRNNARVSLLARLGRAPKNKALQAKVRPAEPRQGRALYLKWVRAFFVLWGHRVSERLDLRHDGRRADAGPLTRLDWESLVDQSGLPAVLDRVSSRVGAQVTSYYGNIFRQPPPKIPREAAIVEDFRTQNVALIKGMGEDQVTRLNATLTDSNALGLRHEEIAAKIQEDLGIGERKAALIARDQTLKYNASVHEAQATASGIEEYDWSTSHDGVVRPTHKELDGKRFRYDDPPITNDEGDRNNPGEDYNCRCAAIPVIKLFEGIQDLSDET